MHARSSLSQRQREALVELFEAGLASRAAANRLGVGRDAVRRLERGWKLRGRLCLMEKPFKQQYSFEVKKAVVERFLAGESKMQLAAAFGLSSADYVGKWARQWREGGDAALMPKPTGRPKGSKAPAPLSETDRLRRENQRLQAENAYLKKIAGTQGPRTRLKVETISTLISQHDLIDLLAAADVAKSTYYYHLARMHAPDKYASLKAEIVRLFEQHKHRFGYRRIHMVLRRSGWTVSKKLVWKLMDQLGLKSKVRVRRKYSSYRGTFSHIADNILDRDFHAEWPNTKWVSDITEFRVAGYKVYLSPIYDLFDHSVVSYTTATAPTTTMTAQSLAQAFALHQPAHGLTVHTDQGIHYQHHSWRTQLQAHHATQSMSRKGNCFDNAVMENFFGHLKAEMYHGEHFVSVEHFLTEIDQDITWYNTQRIQAQLEGMTPMEYREHALKKRST